MSVNESANGITADGILQKGFNKNDQPSTTMNFDNGGGQQPPAMQQRAPHGPPNRMPISDYGPRPVPSGYPSHALPGNVRYSYPPEQQYQDYGYQQQYYPGENGNFSQQPQYYPVQQQQQPMYYQQQQAGYSEYPNMHQQYQQSNPSLAPVRLQQGFQQPPPPSGANSMDSQYLTTTPYGHQEHYRNYQRFPQYPQGMVGIQQPQQQLMMHSNSNQRAPFVQRAAPVRTGFRNPGPNIMQPAYFSRPVRPVNNPPPPAVPQQYDFPVSTTAGEPSWNPQIPCTSSQSVPSMPEAQSLTSGSIVTSAPSPSVMVANSSKDSCSTVTVSSQRQDIQQDETQVDVEPIEKPVEKKVQVPWGWSRAALSDYIIYRSPSGIELKSKEDIKEYLLKEGTCKCGLECPLDIDSVFDFDMNKFSELAPIPETPPNPAKYCSHKMAIVNMAKIMNTPGYSHQFKHVHDPASGKKGIKKRPRKKRPYSGVLTQQMIEAREAEKRRINEIISQQKQEYEAQMSLSIGSKNSGSVVIKPAPSAKEIQPVPALPTLEVAKKPDPAEEESSRLSKQQETTQNQQQNEHAKNIEIRRISATEDGDKVLESAWDSPEKESGTENKTPLQMVQSIVSKIEDVKPASISQPPPPAWTQNNGPRPMLHSQKHVVNDTPPSSRPLVPPVPPAIAKATPISQNVTVMASPQLVPVTANAPGQQQFMQLVNTINGPMLMQTIPQPQIQFHDKNKKMPILISPTAAPAPQAPNAMTSPTGQHLLISSHPSPVGAPTTQFVLNQPAMIAAPNQVFLSANGTLVAMPTAVQGVVYNQLPDGTLVQVQSPMIQPAPQQAIFTSTGSFVINPGQQLSPPSTNPATGQIQFQTPGTYIMTPAGLVQTVPTSMPMTSVEQPQPGPSSTTTQVSPKQIQRKESTEDSDDDSDDEGSQIIKFVQTDEDEDDESSDEEMPLAHKKISPSKDQHKSSKNTKTSSPKVYNIQSNKVDSSGLQATPPHHPNEESESSMNKLSSPEATSSYDQGLDTSGSTDNGPSSSTKSKPKRKRNADDLIRQGMPAIVDSDEDSEDEDDAGSQKTKKKTFNVGELVWGPHGTFPSWPGKLVRFERDGTKVLVCWFGNRDTSQVNPHYLKSLSDGLEAHHRERKKLRKGRKMNASLEKAIQEAMMELDRMTDD